MKILHKLPNDARIALRISLIYAGIAACWILISDQLLLVWEHEPHLLTVLQSIKGWFFVVFTAVVLFCLFRNEIRKTNATESLLKENEQRLIRTQQIARLGSWELDIVNDSLWWSDETYRIFGFAIGDQTAFEKFVQSIHAEDRQRVTELIEQAIREGSPLKLDYRIVVPDGSIRFLHEESNSIFDETLGKVGKRVGSVQDITEQKKMEEERENLIKELEKSLEEIKTLRGILPLCSYCKKIRNDKGYWEQVDVYMHKYLEAEISHSVCPECMRIHHPEYHE